MINADHVISESLVADTAHRGTAGAGQRGDSIVKSVADTGFTGSRWTYLNFQKL